MNILTRLRDLFSSGSQQQTPSLPQTHQPISSQPGMPTTTSNTTVSASSQTASLTGANTPQMTVDDVVDIATKIVDKALKEEAKDLRKDFIAIFGLFAAFITFTVVQIEVFIKATRMSMLMGIASFTFAAFMLLVFCLQGIAKGGLKWRDILSPVVVLITVFMFFSFQCFWWATHGNRLWWFG